MGPSLIILRWAICKAIGKNSIPHSFHFIATPFLQLVSHIFLIIGSHAFYYYHATFVRFHPETRGLFAQENASPVGRVIKWGGEIQISLLLVLALSELQQPAHPRGPLARHWLSPVAHLLQQLQTAKRFYATAV